MIQSNPDRQNQVPPYIFFLFKKPFHSDTSSIGNERLSELPFHADFKTKGHWTPVLWNRCPSHRWILNTRWWKRMCPFFYSQLQAPIQICLRLINNRRIDLSPCHIDCVLFSVPDVHHNMEEKMFLLLHCYLTISWWFSVNKFEFHDTQSYGMTWDLEYSLQYQCITKVVNTCWKFYIF